MRVGPIVALMAAGLWLGADGGASVNSVVATVRSAIRKKHRDADVAAALDKMKLAERLEDRVIEELESEGAGPQTLGALQHMRDQSRLLEPPAGPPPGMIPPPAPSAVEEYRVWQDTRSNSLDYTESLPDFICTETIHRWTDPEGNENWQAAPTIVAELTFFERKESYQAIAVAGQPAAGESILDVGGATSQGEFGTMLATIFNPALETEYRWDHWTTLRKRPTYVYRFRISNAHGPHRLRFGVEGKGQVTIAVGLDGYVYIDRESNRVTRISEEDRDIPAGFPVQKATTVLDYDYGAIGGRQYLLPLRAEVRVDVGKLQSLNTVEFQAYRKFASDATVKFGDAVPDQAPVRK
jgi:hypothetical protein